ncbi:MAG: LacI family DNA-binding transcriptional regulator [Propionicimonas sp.]
MADIARQAGVSATTVSHVLNHTRRVAPATEAAVLAAVAATGYVPDAVTRSMRTARQRMVGLAMSSISNLYFSDVVRGIEKAARADGYSIMLSETHDEPHQELRAVTELLARSVDAIILAASADPSLALTYCAQRNVPVVLVDRLLPLEYDQIGAESIESTAMLVGHLAELGHTRIGMVTSQPGLSTTLERLQGFRIGMARAGLAIDDSLIAEGGSTVEEGERAARALLQRSDRPTGLVLGNNLMTIGTLRAIRGLGLAVPQDVALVAFDDFEWADLFEPRLTVIAQPVQEMGEQVFQLVADRLANPDAPARRVVLASGFRHRNSCGCGV